VCIIVDANVACLVFGNPPHVDYLPVFNWLYDERRNGVLVYGGHLTEELCEVRAVRRWLVRLNQAGRAFGYPDEEIEPEQRRVERMKLCRSDDPHVIALARVSGARTLCSCNAHLYGDFKNKELIDKPRGVVYRDASHEPLLRHTASCRRTRRRLSPGRP
jgi:hypothetical protein